MNPSSSYSTVECLWDGCAWDATWPTKRQARSAGIKHRAEQHGGVGSFSLKRKVGDVEYVYGAFGGSLDE